MFRRMTLPSLFGVSARSDCMMPRSMAGIELLSYGWMTRRLDSGADTLAICRTGVGAP